MRTTSLLAALLLAGVVAVFAPLREHAFVDYDDPVWQVKLTPGLSRDGLRVVCCDEIVGNWIPATALSMLVSRAVHGDDAPRFLLGNVLIHAATAGLLFLLLARTTGSPWPAFFVAAVFAWHPLHVESVAWVSQRKDVLCGFFSALALWLHARDVQQPSRGRRAATTVAVALALLAKPTAVTLPFVLVLFEWWPLRRLACSPRTGLPSARALAGSLAAKWPMLALSAAASFVTYRVQASTGAVAASDALPFPVRAANAVDALRAYLVDFVWPQGLAAFYPHPTSIEAPAATLVTALALAAWTAGVLGLARRVPAAAVGWLWFVGTLVPVLGLVQVGLQARADRYTYWPLVGLALGVVYPLATLATRRPVAQRVLAAAGLAALLALGVAARAQVHTWRDSLSLYTRAQAVAPSAFASLGLGRALRRANRGAEAVAPLGQAAALRPRDATPHLELAEHFAATGELDVAIAHQSEAVQRAPDDPRYAVRLAQLLLQAGRPADARPVLARAAQLLAHAGAAPVALRVAFEQASARVALFEGDDDAARRHAEALLALDPDNAVARGVLTRLEGRVSN
ncbi:MAG TPA: tetratricopeptide repeat protein [Myxococcota bacterium]|nr:tetratricopeptide repeat protein [Myxococcota bacterium]